jgi:hypothetical protein
MLEYYRPMDQREEKKNPKFMGGAPKLSFVLYTRMLVVKKTKKGEGLGGLGLDYKLLGCKGVIIFIAIHNVLYVIMKNAKENFF